MRGSLVIIILSSLICNVAADTWSNKTPMPTKRSDMTAVLVGKTIIVAGGCDTDQVCSGDFCSCGSITPKVEGYKPETNEWITLAPMPVARTRHAAAEYQGKMYIIGGRNVADELINTIAVYNPTIDAWETLSKESDWDVPKSDLVVAIISGTLYAIGGYDANYNTPATTDVFDIASSRWGPSKVSSMAVGRGDACAVAIADSIYVFGGFNNNSFCAPLNSIEVYNAKTNNWSSKKPLKQARADAGCAVTRGEFHLIGGEQKNNLTGCSFYDVPIDHVESYHPERDAWNEETKIPTVRFRFPASTYGDQIYIFGGQSGLDNTTYPNTNNVLVWTDDVLHDSRSSASHIASVLIVIFSLF